MHWGLAMIQKTKERFGFVLVLICLAIVSLVYGVGYSNRILLVCSFLLVPLIFYFLKLTLKLDKDERNEGDCDKISS